jgi:single-stranded DNA-binding protein
MYDYASVQLLGRATSDATFFNLDEPDKTSRAIFTLALNLSYRRGGERTVRTIYRKVVAIGSLATYVHKCQEEGGLRGRLINVIGRMDDENQTQEQIVLVSPSVSGFVKVFDRRNADG